MPVDTTTFHTTLVDDLLHGGEFLTLSAGTSDIQSEIDAGNVVFLSLYNTTGSEVVAAYDIVGGNIRVYRAMNGTTQAPWPAPTCVCAVSVLPGPVCPPAPPAPLVSQLNFVGGAGVEVTQVGNTVTISLAPTGVVAGTYGDATVNAFGQLTDLPPGWPNAVDYGSCVCPDGAG